MKTTILFVPGFVADTYSEIERSYVELCASARRDVEYLWLVPTISYKHNRFARAASRTELKEPVWVPHLRRHGIPYVVADVSKYNPIANLFLFAGIFRRHRISAVYTHFGYERFWAVFFGKLCRRVTIWNEHWHSLGRRYGLLKRLFYRLFVDEFISVSRFISATLPPGRRVHTLPNAIHVDVAPPDSASTAERRRRLGLPQNGAVVLMVAAFRTEKRHGLALDVCRRVLQTHGDTVFVFLGAGELRDQFREQVDRLGLGQRVVTPGHVDNVNDYYAVADVSILTSYYEPFGYVVLEAMRAALPVVAFDNGGPAEVIRHGETGILVKEADVDQFAVELARLIDDADLRRALGARARRAVQQEYNRDTWIGKLNLILTDIVLRRDRGSPNARLMKTH